MCNIYREFSKNLGRCSRCKWKKQFPQKCNKALNSFDRENVMKSNVRYIYFTPSFVLIWIVYEIYIISANEWFLVPRKCSCKNWANNMYTNISLEVALVDACSFSIVHISNGIFDRIVRNICRIRLFTDSLFMYNSLKKNLNWI